MTRILLSGAGGGGSNNLIRAIRATDGDFHLVGTNSNMFALARSAADTNYRIAHCNEADAYVRALNEVCSRESIDLHIPTNDTEVGALSALRDELEAEISLPRREVVETCHDKAVFGERMRSAGIRVARSATIETLGDVDDAITSLGSPDVVWLRLRSGNGSRGTLPVRDAEQARFWIRYWVEARGMQPNDFVFNEFLPGRDFAFEGIWHDGRLVAGKTAQRLEYLFGQNVPSGTMSTPSVGRLVSNPAVVEACESAVAALDIGATGVFSIDLKEDSDGYPNLTEINPGRFFRISPIFNLSGSVNLFSVYFDVVTGRDPSVNDDQRLDDGVSEDFYWLCDIDGAPSVVRKADIEARINDVS